FGLSEIKAEVSAIEAAVFSETFGLSEIKAEVSAIQNDVDGITALLISILVLLLDSDFSLPEIKTEVSAIESALFSETFGLSEIKAEVSDILAIVSNLDFALFSDIKSEVSAIEAAVFSETFGLSEIKAEVSAIETAVFSETFGLQEIKSEVSAILAEFDQLMLCKGPAANLTTGPFLATTQEYNMEVEAFNATGTFQSVTFQVFSLETCPASLLDSVAFTNITPCCGARASLNIAGPLRSIILKAQTSSTFGLFLYAVSITGGGGKVSQFHSSDFLPLGTFCV
ncbi:hypothetical protein, partial [Desulforamulus hydrothermalis]